MAASTRRTYVTLLSIVHLAVVGYCQDGQAYGAGARGFRMPAIPQSFAMVGGAALLNCTSPDPSSHVAWYRPNDGLQVSFDTRIADHVTGDYRIVGDSRQGHYNLLIRHASFPQDNGTWTCTVFNGVRLTTNVMVLVPPDNMKPQVNPISGIIFHVNSEAYTYSCIAHFAYPPVTLRWVKKTGPVMEYNPLPPTITVGPDYTVSSTMDLLLTPMNHGSVFACEAEHPTFGGKVYSTEIQFIIADPSYGAVANQLPLEPPSSRLGPGTVGLITVSCAIIIISITVALVLWRTQTRWELDVPRMYQYRSVPTSDRQDSVIPNGSVHQVINHDHRLHADPERKRCIIKVSVGGALLSIVIVILAYLIPLYLTGFAVPIQGVDEVVMVMAGSLLWLDCSQESTRTADLLVVGWRKDFYRFYNQYNNELMGDNFGVPINSSVSSLERGGRTRSEELGRVSIWPALPSDQGLYICEVARIIDDSGRTALTRKLFAVGVVTTPPLNKPLLVLMLIALLASLALAFLLIYQTLRCVRSRKHGDTNDNIDTIDTVDTIEKKKNLVPSLPEESAP